MTVEHHKVEHTRKLLERELWLLALYWRAGCKLHWEIVHRWIEGLARTCPIHAQA